jgi:enoyl-CoA hydratase/carnithine racemase
VSAGSTISLSTARSGRTDLRVAIPPVNVLGVPDLLRLAACVEEARSARVLVLTGLPRAFSAGVAIADHEPTLQAIDGMLGAMRRVLEALLRAPAVTVAAVAGACLGGGAEIAAACDLVLAASDARIGFPEIRFACFPPGGVALLPARIGPARATEWILTGRVLSGREAAEAGFATRAVEPARLEGETDRLARDLLGKSAAALDAARDLLRSPRREALAALLPRAEDSYRRLAGDPALRDAVSGFESRRRSRNLETRGGTVAAKRPDGASTRR